jgi:hypothetical protein
MPSNELKRFTVSALKWKSLSALAGLAIAVMVSVALLVFAVIASLLATAKIDITEGKLVAGGGLYKVRVPLDRIDVAHARILGPNDPFRLRWRTNGLGWPGLNLGWFSAKGPKRIFAVDTRKSDRVFVPTFENFDIILTPTDPSAFLKELLRAEGQTGQTQGG